MKILVIFNHEPYNGTDVTWNGLRLARKLAEGGHGACPNFCVNGVSDYT